MNLETAFIKYCKEKKFLENKKQLYTINLLSKFYKNNKFSFFNFLKKILNNTKKNSFYLTGDVGVGKTMILDFFYNNINTSRKRFHFNEFMIKFHDFRYEHEKINKDNSIETFVNKLKKQINLIYLDEFQVTNIVDAMILGKLFEIMIKKNILIIITSNTKVEDLYKDGLQREQFLPFISLINKFSIKHELIIDHVTDYRKIGITKLKRYLHPLNEDTSFQLNQLFRKLTKNKKKSNKKIEVKGRMIVIENYYEGISKFKFSDLCEKNIGGEDYIKIAEQSDFIFIENVPQFDEENMNVQQRFITLIDIFYEKKIPLLISSDIQLHELRSSLSLSKPFKRTKSRIYELTSPDIYTV
jgi:cell division protein ZapE